MSIKRVKNVGAHKALALNQHRTRHVRAFYALKEDTFPFSPLPASLSDFTRLFGIKLFEEKTVCTPIDSANAIRIIIHIRKIRFLIFIFDAAAWCSW